jgi:hypothetical protein
VVKSVRHLYFFSTFSLIKVGNDETIVQRIGIREVIKQFEMLIIEEE